MMPIFSRPSKTACIFLIVLAIAGMIFLSAPIPPPEHQTDSTKADPQSVPALRGKPLPIQTLAGDQVERGEQGSTSSLLVEVPTNAQVREEIASNPHGIPPSFITFSRQVSQRLRQARGSQSQSHLLMNDLRSWAQGSDNLVVQAYCLSVARELTSLFADLSTNLAEFENSVSQVARDLSRI